MIAPKPSDIPSAPGSYQFYSPDGEILYVGKAKNLRSRVSSYFQSGPKHNIRIEQMLDIADRVEWIVVTNETEALLLEYSLIQQHKPRYNVRLKDDKSYPWLSVTVNEQWARAGVYRGKHRKGVKYFGPYPSAYSIRETLDVLTTIFPIRTCSPAKYSDYQRRGRPCLLYDVHKCSAPCVNYVDEETYSSYVDSLISFLGGDTREAMQYVNSHMDEASGSHEFEKAAIWRDRREVLQSIIEKQEIYGSDKDNFDVVGQATDDIEICVEVFRVRKGRLIGTRRIVLEPQEISSEEKVIDQILLRLYENQLPDVLPPLILTEELPHDVTSYDELLTQQKGSTVRMAIPQRGSKKKLLDLATQNAHESVRRRSTARVNDVESRTRALEDLVARLSLQRVPLRIECFDISHIQGTNTVASMVVLDDGLPKKSEYRHFTITHDQGNDDFLSMEEAITRRFRNHTENPKFSILPDLLLIDGGKGQLASAMRALRLCGLEGKFDVASLAKKHEEVFRPGSSQPVIIPYGSLSLMLLQVVRDEAHRFAITHHRKKRSVSMTASILDDISGLGGIRKKKLLQSFGSVKNLKEQTRETLRSLAYLPDSVADNIYDALHQEK